MVIKAVIFTNSVNNPMISVKESTGPNFSIGLILRKKKQTKNKLEKNQIHHLIKINVHGHIKGLVNCQLNNK